MMSAQDEVFILAMDWQLKYDVWQDLIARRSKKTDILKAEVEHNAARGTLRRACTRIRDGQMRSIFDGEAS